MTNPQIKVDFTDASGRVLEDAPAGYNVADFFCDRGAWMDAHYERGTDAFYAAQEVYRGRDLDGIGILLTFWDERDGRYYAWELLPP